MQKTFPPQGFDVISSTWANQVEARIKAAEDRADAAELYAKNLNSAITAMNVQLRDMQSKLNTL